MADLEVETPAGTLRGERAGEGLTVFLAHGLTATRRYVIHGSRALERAGYEVISYDARGHGESDQAADDVYDYQALAGDLAAVVDSVLPGGEEGLFAGHSMGAHTIARYALEHPGRVKAACFVGPAYPGFPTPEPELERWDELAEGLETGGVDGFLEVYERREWPADWREVIMRITRERLSLHRDIHAFAEVLRKVPRSEPFGELDELADIECPALVVASHDEADPGHPFAVAEAWANHLPRGELISEDPDASPLAWQGGRLAREIASFFDSVSA